MLLPKTPSVLLWLLPVSSQDKDAEILALPRACSGACTLWCARIPCSAGTAIWSRVGTPSGPGPGARAEFRHVG